MTEPAFPAYLSNPYSARPWQRGGTLLAVAVWSWSEHEVRMLDPEDYRPSCCERCGAKVHSHGERPRRTRDEEDRSWVWIRRYRCPRCRAMWQVLPGLLCRYLHRSWGAVQSRLVQGGLLSKTGAERRVRKIAETSRRWGRRVEASAVVLTQALVGSGVELSRVLASVLSPSRGQLLEALASAEMVRAERKAGDVAVWVHRLVPGIRLM